MALIAKQDFATTMESTIAKAISDRAKEIAEEEIAAASARVQKRIGEEVDRIALSVVGYYEMHVDRDRLVITVRRPSAT